MPCSTHSTGYAPSLQALWPAIKGRNLFMFIFNRKDSSCYIPLSGIYCMCGAKGGLKIFNSAENGVIYRHNNFVVGQSQRTTLRVSDKCDGWNRSSLTYSALKNSPWNMEIVMFQGLRPLKSNERSNVRKKWKAFELEVVALNSGVEIKQGCAV